MGADGDRMMAYMQARYGGRVEKAAPRTAPRPPAWSPPVDADAEVRKAVAAARVAQEARLKVLQADLEKVAARRAAPPGSPWYPSADALAGREPGAPRIAPRETGR